jgi:hypothetical protein
MRYYIVGGFWNVSEGRASGWLGRFAEGLARCGHVIEMRNGGTAEELEDLARGLSAGVFGAGADAVLWWPNVPNEIPDKQLAGLFQSVRHNGAVNPGVVLASSKVNRPAGSGWAYAPLDLVARALDAHANLLVEFRRTGAGSVSGTIWDPLGNTYATDETDPFRLAEAFASRAAFLRASERMPSETALFAIPLLPARTVMGHEKFLFYVRKWAVEIHDRVHAVHQERMLGNCSFRCLSGGFPSMRGPDGNVWVSRRNIEKRGISLENMVPVRLSDDGTKVLHAGRRKPSVDTPVQLRLYDALPNINYLFHLHCYAETEMRTERALPCGDLRETGEVLRIVPRDAERFVVNLRGHGFLAGGSVPEDFEHLTLLERPMPERQDLEAERGCEAHARG